MLKDLITRRKRVEAADVAAKKLWGDDVREHRAFVRWLDACGVLDVVEDLLQGSSTSTCSKIWIGQILVGSAEQTDRDTLWG